MHAGIIRISDTQFRGSGIFTRRNDTQKAGRSELEPKTSEKNGERARELRVPVGFRSCTRKARRFSLMETAFWFAAFYPALALGLRLLGYGAASAFLLPLLPGAALGAGTLVRLHFRRFTTAPPLELLLAAAAALPAAGLGARVLFGAFGLAAAVVQITLFAGAVRRDDAAEGYSGNSGARFLGGAELFGGFGLLFCTRMAGLSLGQGAAAEACLPAGVVLLLLYGVYTHKTGLQAAAGDIGFSEDTRARSRSFTLLFAGAWAAAAAALLLLFGPALAGLDVLFLKGLRGLAGQSGGVPVSPGSFASSGAAPRPHLPDSSHMKDSPLLAALARYLIVPLLTLIALGALALLCVWAALSLRRLALYLLHRRRNASAREVSVFTPPWKDKNSEARAGGLAARLRRAFFGNGNRAKIRRAYARFVESRLPPDERPAPFEAPAEIGARLREKSGADVSGATALYEKARYGGKDCTSEDVERFRSALKP